MGYMLIIMVLLILVSRDYPNMYHKLGSLTSETYYLPFLKTRYLRSRCTWGQAPSKVRREGPAPGFSQDSVSFLACSREMFNLNIVCVRGSRLEDTTTHRPRIWTKPIWGSSSLTYVGIYILSTSPTVGVIFKHEALREWYVIETIWMVYVTQPKWSLLCKPLRFWQMGMEIYSTYRHPRQTLQIKFPCFLNLPLINMARFPSFSWSVLASYVCGPVSDLLGIPEVFESTVLSFCAYLFLNFPSLSESRS